MMLVVLLLATALVGSGGDYPAASSPVRPQPSPQAQADYQRALGQFAAREGKEERGWIESIMSFATSGLGFSDSEDASEEVRSKRPTFYTANPGTVEAVDRTSQEADRRSGGRPIKISAQRRKSHSPAVRPAQESYVGGGLGRLIGGILPNSYYSRPKYRFPYYDHGKGYLMYGYGGKELYEYSVFKPLEGYF